MVKSIDLKAKAKEIEKNHNLNHYEILQRFMFERILERISVSNYQDNFILKGGLLLSAMFGIDNRTTKDMDTTITGIEFSKYKMVKVLNNILSIDLNDGVKFNIVDITDIREDSEYGGNKYHIVGMLENLKVNLEIDITSGDKVTPKKLRFKYPLLFENRSILINSYNIETILAEKIETVLRRGKFNSRMKDYYDIYYFVNYRWNDLDTTNLKRAILRTFEHRETVGDLSRVEEIINKIKIDNTMNNLWKMYREKYDDLCSVEFDACLFAIQKILAIIE